MRVQGIGIAALWLVACGVPGGSVIAGNGVPAEERRPLSNFTSVQVEKGLRVDVQAGRAFEVRVKADANLLSFVHTVQVGTQLTITLPDGVAALESRDGMEITVFLPTLLGVDASGGAQVKVHGGTGDLTRVRGTGGSEVEVDGRGRLLRLELSGGSRFRGGDHPVESLTVELSGGSRGQVRVSSQLSGTLSGGSTLEVIGRPVTIVDVSGGSRIVPQD